MGDARGAWRPVLGLVGQVCAGKSTVARALARLGARVCEADRLVRELYGRADVKRQVRALFGAGVFGADGEVDRRKLGALAFAAPARLRRLTERVVFPRVRPVIEAEIRAFRASPRAGAALVLDAPTLCEAGAAEACDALIFVAAPRARRRAWARARGWERGELERREALLEDEALKRARCALVLKNGGTRAQLRAAVAAWWRSCMAAARPAARGRKQVARRRRTAHAD